MKIHTETYNGVLVAKLGGRIDGINAENFHSALLAAIEDSEAPVIVDCERLSYISSVGLRVILQIAQRLNRQRVEFGICSLQEPIRDVFQISGFDKIIAIHPTLAIAIDAIAH